jgi:hypothetical protein
MELYCLINSSTVCRNTYINVENTGLNGNTLHRYIYLYSSIVSPINTKIGFYSSSRVKK